MNITNIKMRRKDHGSIKAVVCLILDGDYALNDICIIQGKHRLFVKFPEGADGRIFFVPLSQEARSRIESTILSFYQNYQTA